MHISFTFLVPIFIFKKDNINDVGECVKDGIHMIIGLRMKHGAQMVLRDLMLKEIGNVLHDMRSVLCQDNTPDMILDEGICRGDVGWQMYGSSKPGHEAYKLTSYYQVRYMEKEDSDVELDSDDEEETGADAMDFECKIKDIADWEECSDGLGKIYYFNTKTNESRWEKPQFLQAGIKLKRGPGFDGMRIGRLENVEDWEECRDATGNNYYYNNKNGKSQWTRPRFRNEGDHPKKGMGFGDAHEEHLEDENHGHGTAKRSDWHEHKDNAGRVYWYNDKTGESQWLQPHFMSEDEEIELHHQEMEEQRALCEDSRHDPKLKMLSKVHQ